MTPLGRIRAATRAAQIGAAPYSISTDQMVAAVYAAMRRLRKRWPKLDPTDPRAAVEDSTEAHKAPPPS
jgi:hypothetical protein